ncbi:MAG TPA: ribosome maturation factor RimP [Thermoanaerobaculia bacterium]|nr:ribosome maturation factor RimP [Thermoanaerobaculia bacterium]
MSTARRTGAAGRLDPDLRAEFEAIADSIGCELVEAESKGGTLRLFIDRPDGGVTLADCERVSRLVSALLDVVDFGKDRYVLEVSSPGLDRQLYRPRDYERFTGQRVRVTFLEPDGGGKRTVVGRLERFRPVATQGQGAEGGEITVVTDDDERLELPLEQVQVARLEIEF